MKEVKRKGKESRNLFEERKRRLETTTFSCPVDGKQSKFMKMTGSFQTIVPVFKCPDGHTFSVRSTSQGQVTMLISD